MKTLKAICTAAILALALSVPAYAGDMRNAGLHCATHHHHRSQTSPGT